MYELEQNFSAQKYSTVKLIESYQLVNAVQSIAVADMKLKELSENHHDQGETTDFKTSYDFMRLPETS